MTVTPAQIAEEFDVPYDYICALLSDPLKQILDKRLLGDKITKEEKAALNAALYTLKLKLPWLDIKNYTKEIKTKLKQRKADERVEKPCLICEKTRLLSKNVKVCWSPYCRYVYDFYKKSKPSAKSNRPYWTACPMCKGQWTHQAIRAALEGGASEGAIMRAIYRNRDVATFLSECASSGLPDQPSHTP